MAVVFCTGFEYGTTVGWANGNAGAKVVDAVVGSPAITAVTAPHSGTYSMVSSCNNNAAAFQLTTDTLGTGQTAGVLSFWVHFPTMPIWQTYLARIVAADANECRIAYSPTGYKLTAWHSTGGAVIVSTFPVSSGQWYLVDIRFDVSTNPHVIEMKVDGLTVYAAGLAQLTHAAAPTTISSITIGTDPTDSIATVWFDDVLVSTTAADFPLGGHKVVLLKPDTAGTATEIGGVANQWAAMTAASNDTTFDSAAILANISEVPPSVATTEAMTGAVQRANSASGSGSGSHAIDIPMTSYTIQTGETIGGLRLLVCGYATNANPNDIAFRTYNGTTETELFARADPNFDASTTPSWIAKMATLADFNTQTELDAMSVRAGYSTDVAPTPGMHAVYVETAVRLYRQPIAYDATTRYPASDGTDATTGDVTFTHTAADTIAAVAVVVMSVDTEADTDPLTGILYGDYEMVKTRSATSYEAYPTVMRVEIWTLLIENYLTIPGGTQTITLTGCSDVEKWIQVTSLTSPTYIGIADAIAHVDGMPVLANPFIQYVTTSRTLAVGGIIGSFATPLSDPMDGVTLQETQDFGSVSSMAIRRTNEDDAGTIRLGFDDGNYEAYASAAAVFEVADRYPSAVISPIARYYD